MLIKKAPDIRSSEITPKALYLRRREFIQGAALAAAGALAGPFTGQAHAQQRGPGKLAKLANVKPSRFSTTEKLNDYDDVTSYNNFYEFGTDKDDPGAQRRARSSRVRGRSRSKGSSRSPATTTSTPSSSLTRSRSASIGCAVSRRGRW